MLPAGSVVADLFTAHQRVCTLPHETLELVSPNVDGDCFIPQAAKGGLSRCGKFTVWIVTGFFNLAEPCIRKLRVATRYPFIKLRDSERAEKFALFVRVTRHDAPFSRRPGLAPGHNVRLGQQILRACRDLR